MASSSSGGVWACGAAAPGHEAQGARSSGAMRPRARPRACESAPVPLAIALTAVGRAHSTRAFARSTVAAAPGPSGHLQESGARCGVAASFPAECRRRTCPPEYLNPSRPPRLDRSPSPPLPLTGGPPVQVSAFEKRVSEWRGIVMGLASQFVLLPFLGFLVVKTFDLEPVAGITLLITTTSPGGGFSGLFCSLSNADLALSVAMTTVSTVLTMVMMPLNIVLYINSTYGVAVELPWGSLFLTVGVVILAVVVGLGFSYYKPQWSNRLNVVGTVCGICNIFLAAGSSGTSDTPFWEHPPLFILSIGLPCFIGLVISFVMSKLVLKISAPQAVAISIECCYQNTALAITVAFSVFKGQQSSLAAGIPLIYGMAEPALIAPFCLLAWRMNWTYCPRDETFLRWLSLNWQPGTEHLNALRHDGTDQYVPRPVDIAPHDAPTARCYDPEKASTSSSAAAGAGGGGGGRLGGDLLHVPTSSYNHRPPPVGGPQRQVVRQDSDSFSEGSRSNALRVSGARDGIASSPVPSPHHPRASSSTNGARARML